MKITKELLKRHSMGLCSEEEKRAVEEWLKVQDDSLIGLKILKEKEFEQEDEVIWSKLSQAIPELQDEDPSQSAKVLSLPGRFTRYAAALAILFTVGISVYFSLNHLADMDPSEQAYFEDFKSVQTERGEKRTVTLSDGSTIRMNYETEVSVPEKFEGEERVVYLRGHAHFEVKKNPEKPFIVYTEDTKTRVLGTSFDINTKGADETEIIVTSGKVTFSEKGINENIVTLTVNGRAVLDANRSILTNEVDADKLTAWRNNRLVFEGKTLKEVIEVLEPWYDVKIAVQDPRYLEVAFSLSGDNPSLKSFLKELCFAGRFNYRIEGKKVTLY